MEGFIIAVVRKVEEKLGAEYTVLKNSVVKANDIVLNALAIKRKDDVVAKNIYLEQYYEMYKGGRSVDDIVEHIVQESQDDRNFLDSKCKEYVSNIYDYAKIKDRIIVKLLSKSRNVQYLSDKVYISYLDFAVLFQILIDEPSKGIMTTAVVDTVFKDWGMPKVKVYEQALSNMKKLMPVMIESLDSKILKMAEESGAEMPEDIDIEGGITPLYVLSNKYMVDGATSILYKSVLRDFAMERGVDEVVIIPSSIHEMLLLPKYKPCANDEKTCRVMLREVNDTLESNLVLSDNIYVYNRIEEVINIWNG